MLSRSRAFKAGLSGCHIAALPAAYGPAWRPAAPAMAAVDIDFEDFGLDWQPLAPKMCIACGCYALPKKGYAGTTTMSATHSFLTRAAT